MSAFKRRKKIILNEEKKSVLNYKFIKLFNNKTKCFSFFYKISKYLPLKSVKSLF